MPFENSLPVHLGNLQGWPNAYQNQVVRWNGREVMPWYGYAVLTGQDQTAVPVYIPSFRDQQNYPDKIMRLPLGAQVNYAGFTLPPTREEGSERLNGELATGVNILGTTGDRLKISMGADHGFVDPGLSCVNSKYAPDSWAAVARNEGQADGAANSTTWIKTVPSAVLDVQLLCSNSTNTGPGSGIRLSTSENEAFVWVWIFLSSAMRPPRAREVTQINAPVGI